MATVVASAAAAAEHLPIPLDGGKVSLRKDTGASRKRALTGGTAGTAGTGAVTAASTPSARRAPKHTTQAAAAVATAKAPAQTPRRARPQLAPAEDPEPSPTERRYPTLARAAVAITPATESVPPSTGAPGATEAAGSEDADRGEEQPSAHAHVPGQRHDVAQEDAASAPDTPPPARAPRPTVALRRPPATKRLSADDLLAEREEPSSWSAPRATVVPRRPRPLPDAELVVPVAGGHAAVATVAALAGATLLIAGQSGAFWLLALTAIAGVGGWLGYVLGAHRRTRRAAGYALLVSQLGVLGWLLALAGARAAVLMLAPIPLLLALRIAGRSAAILAALGALALYAAALAMTEVGGWQPTIAATPNAAALLDAALVCVGLLGMLAGALAIRTRQARAEATTRARLYELRVQRARSAELRQQAEDDADTLARALAEALRGKGIEPIRTRGPLRPVAEPVMAVAERLATLQQDREDRVRMDAALRAVIREVERAWLGLPWVWPRASGTALDELIALLRAPRPQDAQAVWPRETPTLLTLPTIDTAPTPRVSIPGISSNTNSRPSAPDLTRIPTRAQALPWSEWDEWRGWKPTEERDRA